LIVKQTDIKTNLQKHQLYGYNAEKQMAFYLKREFEFNEDILVINDLRLVMDDNVAQMDHLIIHSFGFIIIESKSVTAEIEINEYGEWIRHYSGYSKGMPSPINQATRQLDFLKKFLTLHEKDLLRKRLMFNKNFSDFKYDVMVAISDNGIIKRPKGLKLPEVHKADQITYSVKQTIDSYARVNNKLLTLDISYQLVSSTMRKIALLLMKSHTPAVISVHNTQVQRHTKQEHTECSLETSAPTQKVCKHCQSENIEILHGRFGYYFKCLDCNKNTKITLTCKHKTCKPKLRKSKLMFYSECPSCETSALYFKNDG